MEHPWNCCQFSIRSLTLATVGSALLLGALFRMGPTGVAVAAVLWLVVGSLLGALDYPAPCGLGAVRGSILSGAVAGGLAGLVWAGIGLLALWQGRTALYWPQAGLAFYVYWWAATGALLGGILGSLIRRRASPPRRGGDEVASLEAHVEVSLTAEIAESHAPQRCSFAWREGLEQIPSWFASVHLHVLLALVLTMAPAALGAGRMPIPLKGLDPLISWEMAPDGDPGAYFRTEATSDDQGDLTAVELPSDSPQVDQHALDPAYGQTKRQVGETQGSWGHLRGRFVYDGIPPTPRVIPTPGVTLQSPVVDETLLVDPLTRGVANVVIYLRNKGVEVHPALLETSSKEAHLVAREFRFVPHVLLARMDQEIVFASADSVSHNANFQPIGDTGFGPLIPAGGRIRYGPPTRVQTIPQPVSCNIHPWMKGYILHRPNPYAAVSDKDGAFSIPLLPAGDLEFQVWHERAGYLQAKPEWTRGRFTISMESQQDLDLGEIKLSPALFK